MPRHGYQSRHELLERLRADRSRLLTALGQHGWETPDASGWTGTDHLAHVAAWLRRVARWFEDEAAGRPVHWPEPGHTLDQIDALNERDRLASRGRALDDVRSEFEETHAAIVGLVERLTSDELNAADQFPRLGFPAKDAIARNSFGHYLDHVRMLEQELQ